MAWDDGDDDADHGSNVCNLMLCFVLLWCAERRLWFHVIGGRKDTYYGFPITCTGANGPKRNFSLPYAKKGVQRRVIVNATKMSIYLLTDRPFELGVYTVLDNGMEQGTIKPANSPAYNATEYSICLLLWRQGFAAMMLLPVGIAVIAIAVIAIIAVVVATVVVATVVVVVVVQKKDTEDE